MLQLIRNVEELGRQVLDQFVQSRCVYFGLAFDHDALRLLPLDELVEVFDGRMSLLEDLVCLHDQW